MDFRWAEMYPDLHRICVLFQRTDLQRVRRMHYTPLKGYLQAGPQCGVVALAMARGDPSVSTVNEIFEMAKILDYTINGEMCSVDYMRHLAELCLENHGYIDIYNGYLDSERIRSHLLAGGMLLVPFDADKNNQPGMLRGNKAHWCVISGGIETEDGFYVVARHGKALNIAIWPLNELAASNGQLEEFSPSRQHSDMEYKLPEGGIGGPNGLKNRAVLIPETRHSPDVSPSLY